MQNEDMTRPKKRDKYENKDNDKDKYIQRTPSNRDSPETFDQRDEEK